MQRYKLIFFTPRPSTQLILQHLFARFPQAVGRIGAYGGCAFVSPGTGQFLPLQGANPTIGTVGTPETVEEDRVEVLVRVHTPRDDQVPHADADAGVAREDHEQGVADICAILDELKKVHPYEEVAYDVYKLEDF